MAAPFYIEDDVSAILDNDLDASIRGVSEAVTLPPGCYSSATFYDFEKRAMMRQWFCVGRVEQLSQPGDFFTVTLFGEPLVAVRNNEGVINVMSSVCRHRCMVITAPARTARERWTDEPPETSGNKKTFQCPYHFWTYDLDGCLVGAPHMEQTAGFNKGDIRLPHLKVELWNGFIMATLDREASPLAPRLEKVADYTRNWNVDKMTGPPPQSLGTFPFNWKVFHENALEAYHASTLHIGLHDKAPSENLEPVPFDDGDAAVVCRQRTTEPDIAFNPTDKPLFPVIDSLTEEDHNHVHFISLPPTLLIGYQCDAVFYTILWPEAVDRTSMWKGVLMPESSYRTHLADEKLEMAYLGFFFFGEQDYVTNSGVHKGLQSTLAERGRYSWQEDPLPNFNRWLVRAYGEARESVKTR